VSNSEIHRVSRATEGILGVILAGGKSRRFGRPKALATLGGAPMASWGMRALQAADLPVVVISDEDGVEAALGVPVRPDLESGLGPLGGLWTALQWASERGDDGVLLLGCDMPLVGEALVRTVLGWSADAPAVVPLGSDGPEPLCGLYRAACASTVEHRLHSEDLSMHGLAQAIGAVFIQENAVANVADPNIDFLNVNTPPERNRAETLLEVRHPGGPAGPPNLPNPG
jgi:molybdopterin-guanine dinucleotide biosynthesis protein A